jgi:HNH endonuclease
VPSHIDSTQYSQNLCDALFRGIQSALDGAVTHTSANWCSYSIANHPRFCFVQHNAAKIKVFLKIRETDGPQLEALLPTPRNIDLVRRTSIAPGWSAETAYFVDIPGEKQVSEVLPLLAHVAHIAIERSNTKQPNHRLWNLPSELITDDPAHTSFWEGSRTTVLVNRYERDPRARKNCIQKYGAVCSVCGFDFAQRYGPIGVGFIHVHHIVSLSSVGRKYKVDPIADLRPVCPNCHEMLHRQNPPLSIEELKERLLTVRSRL